VKVTMAKLAGLVAVGLWVVGIGGRAAAQDVEITIKVSPKLAHEVSQAVDVGRDLGREIGEAVRGAMVDLASLSRTGRMLSQDRDFTAEQVDRVTRTLQLGPSGSLELKNIVGDITVTAGSGREVTVEIIRRARGRTAADARLGLERVQVEVDQRGERASVQARYPDEHHAPYSVSTIYTVTAPAGTHVTASSIAGNVTIKDIQGDLSVDLVSGNIDISSAGRISVAKTISGSVTVTGASTDGSLEIGSISGSIMAQDIKCRQLDMSTISGNVRAREVTCGGAQLKSMMGTVEYTGPLARSGRYELQSHAGQVLFTPTGSTGFELQANTFSGEIRTEMPLTLQGSVSGHSMMRRSIRGTFGDGSAVVIATTFSGNVIIGRK
jgi:hypothetical protein